MADYGPWRVLLIRRRAVPQSAEPTVAAAMKWLLGKRTRASSGRSDLSISEEDGIRFLHLGGEHIQSAMRITAPHALELDYTRTMMAFLLFHPRPSDCLMIGLGGGSIPKFIHRRLRQTRVRAIELDPAVVTAARSLFHVPPEDARMRIEIGDGAKVVRAAMAQCDVLFADGFIDGKQVPELVSEEFYGASFEALRSPGILVVNFFGHDRRFTRYLKRIERPFEGRVVCLEAREDGNVIAFGLKGLPERISWDALRTRAARLEARLGLPFGQFVKGLRRMNRWTRKDLLLAPL